MSTEWSVDDKFLDVACGDGCGEALLVRLPESAPPGWQWYDVRRAWRCGECARLLAAVNQQPLAARPLGEIL